MGGGAEDKQERWKSRKERKLKGGKGERVGSITESVLTQSQGCDDL